MHTETCVHCGTAMEFERHPSDWPNHPGEAGEVRVKIECPECGGTQFTEGITEQEYVERESAALLAEARAEVGRRLAAGDGGGGSDVSGG